MKARHAHEQEIGFRAEGDQPRGYIEDPTLRDARKAFGPRFFGVEEYARWFPDLLAQLERGDIEPFPWPVGVITGPCPFVSGRSIAQTHIAFLGLERVGGGPLSFGRWRQAVPELFRPVPYGSGSHVTARTCTPRWYLMPLYAPSANVGRSYGERLAALPQEYAQASVIEEATKRILVATADPGGLAQQKGIAFCSDPLPKSPDCDLQFLPALGPWDEYVLDLKYFPRRSHWWETFTLSVFRKQP